MSYMFGKRSDGRRLRKISPIFLLMPLIMKKRSDAQVFYSQEIPLAPLDEYIVKKEAEGIKMSYMAIIYSALVRILAEKPLANRFVMNGRVYARNSIDISLAIKKGMSETAEETTLKLHFNGSENIFDIKNKLEQVIAENKDAEAENVTKEINDIGVIEYSEDEYISLKKENNNLINAMAELRVNINNLKEKNTALRKSIQFYRFSKYLT